MKCHMLLLNRIFLMKVLKQISNKLIPTFKITKHFKLTNILMILLVS